MMRILWNVAGPALVVSTCLIVKRTSHLNDRDKSVILLILFVFSRGMWLSSCVQPYHDNGGWFDVAAYHSQPSV